MLEGTILLDANLLINTTKRFGVQMHYFRLTMWSVMCATTNVLVQQKLGWCGAYAEKQ